MFSFDIVKASISAVIYGIINKSLTTHDNKDIIKASVITGGSVIVVDAVFSLTSTLPAFFMVLGAYAKDVVSALLSAGILSMGGKIHGVIPKMPFGMSFLYALGSNILATYAETPVRGMLPAYGPVKLG